MTLQTLDFPNSDGAASLPAFRKEIRGSGSDPGVDWMGTRCLWDWIYIEAKPADRILLCRRRQLKGV